MAADQDLGLRRLTSRFTRDGSEALEQKLSDLCEQVSEAVCRILPPSRLQGIVLGGGYGRGEGGVLRTAEGDFPYNDLEFYVFIHGNLLLQERKYRKPLHEVGEKLAPAAALEVEFKLTSQDYLQRAPPNMFFYDLVSAHRLVAGDPEIFSGCAHHLDGGRIPLSEATRLLMNRCSGLLFAQERLHRRPLTEEDADFVGRNHAKAKLAFGDVVLVANHQYHWSCVERQQRLQTLPATLPWHAEICSHHAQGVEFKFHPQHKTASLEQFESDQRALVNLARHLWLWLESERLGRPFASALDYARSPANKCPETNAYRNRLVNAKRFGPGALLEKRGARYPRERLFNALALLLWEPNAVSDSLLVRRLQGELNTPAQTFRELVFAYRDLWQHFN